MTDSSNDVHPQDDPGGRFAIGAAVIGTLLLIVSGLVGWTAMGPALFHAMATGVGWLCM